MKKLLAFLLALLMLLGGAAFAEETGLTKDIVVLFTSDVHCGIDQGFDAQPRDRRGDVLIAYLPALSHGHGLLHRYQSSVMRSTSQGFPQRGRCTGLPAPAEMTIRPSTTP